MTTRAFAADMPGGEPGRRPLSSDLRWSLAVLAVALPLLLALGVSMWKTPYPVNETIGLLEDIERATHRELFDPSVRAWFRPLYFETWALLWRGTGSLETALAAFKAIEVALPMALVLLLIWHLRPRTLLEAAAASCAVAVLVGSPGFRDNLEIPLLMTLAGMPLALIVWMLLTREPRPWHGIAIVILTFAAIGYKEQGLVIVPVVVAAWWTRAPGAGARLTAALTALTVAYLAWRLNASSHWAMFEQSMGLGFQVVEPTEAVARFGAFPYWMYAYNSLSTMLNVLFGEPTAGLFGVTRSVVSGAVEGWQIVPVVSSVALTGMIAWWAMRVIPGVGRTGWTPEGRAALALMVALLASGVLSFQYSRDRLGGMAAVFYALAAYEALRHFALRAAVAAPARPPHRLALAAGLLALIAVTWHVRAMGTLEWTRRMSEMNTIGWLTELAPRRVEFADRPGYLALMNRLFAQGVARGTTRQTTYPLRIQQVIAPPPVQ